jgi:hypothetical protein
MLKDQIRELFKDYRKDVQIIIAKVLKFEQENITRDRPQFKSDIKAIISKVVKDED